MIRAIAVLLSLFFASVALQLKRNLPASPGVLPGERPVEISPDPKPPKKG